MKFADLYFAALINTSKLPNNGQVAGRDDIDAILSIVFAIIGSISVLMVVIGGLRYITANGDPSGVSQAKKTIIYALVGVVVSLVAFSIVQFVVRGVS